MYPPLRFSPYRLFCICTHLCDFCANTSGGKRELEGPPTAIDGGSMPGGGGGIPGGGAGIPGGGGGIGGLLIVVSDGGREQKYFWIALDDAEVNN